MRELYKITGTLPNKAFGKDKPVKAKSDQLITDAEQMRRWTKYFRKVLANELTL
jgi:hypothetical protein